MSQNCGLPEGFESQCCLNRYGMCTLDTADFRDIDRAIGMRGCGFIGVNDRYLLWKYGVPYKDLNCGNCGYYEGGEYSYGICTNEEVKPHTKGVKVNGEKTYIDSNDYYNGAHACKKFIKKEKTEEDKEVIKEMIDKNQECRFNNLTCPNYCAHNAGCALLLMYGGALENFIKEYNVDCEVYREISDRVLGKPETEESINEGKTCISETIPQTIQTKEDCLTCGECEDLTESGRCSNLYSDEHSKDKKAENASCDSFRLKGCIEKLSIETSVSSDIQVFDYSTVDAETAGFLQEKANKITEIRIKSVIALGKELKEAHDKLANNKTGTFMAWCKSIGYSWDTVSNYIRAFNYISENFGHIEDAENIQPSLLFAASKPSASKELSEKVASGDITTHKQYKKLEDKLKEANEHIEKTNKYANEHMKRARDAEMEVENKEKFINQLRFDKNLKDKEIQNLNQQLDQVKRNGDPAKVQELGKVISGKQQEIDKYQQQIGSLNQQIINIEKQLKEKPIEVPATKEVEVIPDEVRNSIYSKVAVLYEGLLNLTQTDIKIFVEDIDSSDCDDISAAINAAINVLEKIDSAILEAQSDI